MTNNKEILPQYSDQLEMEIKDMFLWAIGQNAITEMTKTVREREREREREKEPSSLPLYKLYTLFQLHFTPERKVQQSRFLRPQTGRRRIRGGCLETNTRSREKLRIRNNNRSRTSIKILIRYREIEGLLRPQKENQKKRYVNRGNHRSTT